MSNSLAATSGTSNVC